MLILLIPMPIIGLSVSLTSKGGQLFIQERLGKDGNPFKMIKFRTMRKDAERTGAQWSKMTIGQISCRPPLRVVEGAAA